MCCRGPHPVHVDAVVVCPRRCERGVCDALSVQAKPDFLWVVLGHWECARNHLRLMPVAKAMLVCVWVVLTSWLPALQVCVVEDLCNVLDGLALLERCGHCESLLQVQCMERVSSKGVFVQLE